MQKILKQLRKEKGITQKELANQLGISPSTIAMYETGQRNPDSSILSMLSDFFDVTTDYLLGKSNIRNPYDENKVSNEKVSTIAAHLDADELSDDDLDDINKFIEFVKAKKNK